VGAKVGSDVPFFVYGGTALVEGRGERVTALPDVAETWLLIVAPSKWLPENKTNRMYGALTPERYTDGSKTSAAVRRLRGLSQLEVSDLGNVFDDVEFPLPMLNRLAGPGSEEYRRSLIRAGAASAHVCGAGPSVLGTFQSRGEAEEAVSKLSLPETIACVAETLGTEEATRVEVSGGK
jgi:4-diphosphocytidyl-2-C-methyl-D-erythritol kinase